MCLCDVWATSRPIIASRICILRNKVDFDSKGSVSWIIVNSSISLYFPLEKKTSLKCDEISLFSKNEGLLASTFRTSSTTEGTLCVTGALMSNEYHREIRVTNNKISFFGQDPNLNPFRYDIPVDASNWTTFVLEWSHKNSDEHITDFTCHVDDQKHYFSLRAFHMHMPNFVIGKSLQSKNYFYGYLKSFELWHSHEVIPPKLIHLIQINNV